MAAVAAPAAKARSPGSPANSDPAWSQYVLAAGAEGAVRGRAMPKGVRVQGHLAARDGLDALARVGEDVAAKLAETDQASLDHVIRAAEIEFDRVAEAEVRSLVLRQRRARAQRELSARKLVKAPLHPPSLDEVGGTQKQSALSARAPPQKDRRAAMKHLADVAHKELHELTARLARETEKAVDEVLIEQRNIAELELERLFRDQKVERELLSRDINQHYARLYSEGTLDMGFNTQALLMFSKRYQDAQRTEQLRADLNSERDQRLLRALREMDERHAADIALVKAEARKRSKLAQDKRRSECDAHNTSVLSLAKSRIATAKSAKEKELLKREKEAADMEMAVKAATKEADQLKINVAHSFQLAHKSNAAASSRDPTPVQADHHANKWGRGGIVTVEESEAAELAQLQKTLDLERAQLLRKIEREWQHKSKPAMTRHFHAAVQQASGKADVDRFKQLSKRKEAAVLAALFPERFVDAADSEEEDGAGTDHGGATPPTLKKGTRRENPRAGRTEPHGVQKQVQIKATAKSAGVTGRPAPRTAAHSGHGHQALAVHSAQLHAPPLTGGAAGGGGCGGGAGAVVAASVNRWADASVAWRRVTADTPSTMVSAASLQPGARVRCFYHKGGRKSASTDVGVVTAASSASHGPERSRPDTPATPSSPHGLSPGSHPRSPHALLDTGTWRRRSAQSGRKQRVDMSHMIEVLFDDGALQDVPKKWILSLHPERKTPEDEVLREVKDGICRVTRGHTAQRAGELTVVEGERVMFSETHPLSHKHRGWVYVSRIAPQDLSLSPQKPKVRAEAGPSAGRAGERAVEARVVSTDWVPGEPDGEGGLEEGDAFRRVGGLVPRDCIELSWGGVSLRRKRW